MVVTFRVFWPKPMFRGNRSLLSICFCSSLHPTDMRRFHVYQCPQSLQSWSADACHWYTEELVFALLQQFAWFQTATTLPQDLRRFVKVHDTQVFHHTNLKQSTVANEQHCGQCLLHASCGNLWEHSCLDCLLKSGDTISILTVPPRHIFRFYFWRHHTRAPTRCSQI